MHKFYPDRWRQARGRKMVNPRADCVSASSPASKWWPVRGAGRVGGWLAACVTRRLPAGFRGCALRSGGRPTPACRSPPDAGHRTRCPGCAAVLPVCRPRPGQPATGRCCAAASGRRSADTVRSHVRSVRRCRADADRRRPVRPCPPAAGSFSSACRYR